MDRVSEREAAAGDRAASRSASPGPRVRALALISSAFAVGHRRAQVSGATARLIAQALDGGCAIRWLTPRSSVAVAHASRAQQAWLRTLAREDPAGLAGAFEIRVRQTREPAVVPMVWSGLLRLWTSPAYWAYLESHEVISLLVMPLCTRQNLVGVMTAWREHPRPAFIADDVEFLEEVTRRLAQC